MTVGTAWAILLAAAAPAPQEDGAGEIVAVRAGRVIPVEGAPIEDALILIRGGVIREVGRDVRIPEGARVIDATRMTVLPGLIEPYTTLGLVRSRGGVSGSANNADTLAAHEFRPVDEDLARLVRAGYTLAGLYPSDGAIAGRMVVVRTAGPPDQRVVVREGPMRMGVVPRTDVKKGVRDAFEAARRALREQQQAQQQQQPQSGQPQRQEPDDKTKAMMAVLRGEVRLMAEATDPAAILHLFLAMGERPPELKWALVTGADAWRARDHLAGLTVLLPPSLAFVPYTRDEVNPARELESVGARVVFSIGSRDPGRYEEVWVRLAVLVRAGLSREVALEAVTKRPAEVLGVADRFGAIAAGREGDLVFLTGNPFDATACVARVMVRGQVVYEEEPP